MFESIGTSLRLTAASFRLIFRKPIVMTLPLLTLLWIGALIIGPVNFFVWWQQNFPAASTAFWKGVFFVAVSAWDAGNYQGAVWAAVATGFAIWAVWMTFALWGVLYVVTVGMDVATQQIKRRPIDLGAAFRLATKNLGRLLLLALVLATLVAWFRYLVSFTFRLIPFAGRWLNRGFRLVLTAVTYLMLPIVIYERAGPISALKSAWRNVRKTWSGLILGTSILYVAVWAIFSLFGAALLNGALGLKGPAQIIVPVTLGGILFAVASSTAAAMRATLYWYATTGEVPEGFNASDLPTISNRAPFTTLAAATMVAVPTATTFEAPRPTQPGPNPPGYAKPTSAKAAPLPPGTRRTTCPQCKAAVLVPAGKKPFCSSCGFGTQ